MNDEEKHRSDFDRARELVLRFGWNSISYQILNPGLLLWFSSSGTSVIAYVSTGTHHIAAGAPIGDENELSSTVIEFTHFTSSLGKKVCFFGAQERIASILEKRSPTSSILLGAQPIWSPKEWLARVQTKPSLRQQFSRAVNKGVSVEICTGRTAGAQRNGLNRCLNEWIDARHLPPMHFLVEPNTLENLQDRIVAVALMKQTVVGYCIASPIPLRNGWLIEQIIRGNDAPNGTAELLLEQLVKHIHSIGSSFITLGLSPLSRHYHSPLRQPLWLSVALKMTRLYGKYFYNFDGLDSFKSKFIPESWEPVYAITNERRATPQTLHAIATAFSGISPFTFVLKGILKSF
ncbi:MAG: DUF2156 domain-containing protein [Bacteroidota bacterium]